MWNVNPKLMCNKHLLGEHVEMHMFIGCLSKGKNIDGYIKTGLVDVHNISKRHSDLVYEMKSRGMNHKSDIGPVWLYRKGRVDKDKNLIELRKRCKRCETMK